ncbi:MAG: hypothetical protein OEY10_03455, partial [Nitrosopumilus sp.]|nr:hypothetical protein [Nitrosopumilus sp.]
IKTLLRANEIDFSWFLIDKMIPKESKSEDRAYTRAEIQKRIIVLRLIALVLGISYLAHQCLVENCNQKYCALNVHARTMFPKMVEFHTCTYFIKNMNF